MSLTRILREVPPRPSPVMQLAGVQMEFHNNDWFSKEPNVGYETLFYDVMIGTRLVHARRHDGAGLARGAAGA